MNDADLLDAVLDTLLPGDGVDWPAAGAHGLATKTREMAALHPEGAKLLNDLLDGLPDGFSAFPADVREAHLADIETRDPQLFAVTLSAAYNAYYTDTDIRDIIERVCGYENRPPQPLGYELPPFDESLLDHVKARGSTWREVPGE